MRRPRRNHSAAFKAKVAVAAIKATRPWPNLLSDLTFIQVHARLTKCVGTAGNWGRHWGQGAELPVDEKKQTLPSTS
jgi:hypothetical protein